MDAGERLCRYGRLAVMLAERGHQVRFWASHFDHALKRPRAVVAETLQPAPNLAIELIKAPSYPSNVSFRRILHNHLLARRFLVRAEGLTERPDIIFAGIPCLEMAEAAVDFGVRHRIPRVADIEDVWPELYLTALPTIAVPLGRRLLWWEFRRARRLLRNASAITAVSRSYLSWALDLAGRRARSTDGTFPLGFPEKVRPPENQLRAHAQQLRARFDIPADRRVAVYVGQFGASYDIATIIEAARILQNRIPDLQFILVGDGDKGPALRRQAEGLPNVTFTGWLKQAEVLAMMDGALFGLAAYAQRATQSLPFKPFEYMAASLPIASSLSGELADLLREHQIGRQYVAGDPASLAGVAEFFGQNPALAAAMGQQARKIFLQHYNSDMIYSRLIERLAELVRAR